MSDKLVFDLAQEIEGSPNIFIRKDWLNILDNQAQNYNGNQSVIDTSQLSNSNKWMNYREAYLSMPLLITVGTAGAPVTAAGGTQTYFTPASIVQNGGTAAYVNSVQSTTDYGIGLKNWYGSIIHSFTLDYNGTTIIQQTPFINLWNNFRLLTSLSWSDIQTQGTVIGFYPDTSTSFTFSPAQDPTIDNDGVAQVVLNGQGTCNNGIKGTTVQLLNNIQNNNFDISSGNIGLFKRMQNINFDLDGMANGAIGSYAGIKYGLLITGSTGNNEIVPGNASPRTPLTSSTFNNIWKNYISNKTNQTAGGAQGVVQYSIVATIYLKHIHSFFNMVPLLKGTFMKMTLNLNNSSFTFVTQNATNNAAPAAGQLGLPTSIVCTGVTNPFGGVNPLMIASANPIGITEYPQSQVEGVDNNNVLQIFDSGSCFFPQVENTAGANTSQTQSWVANISVGAVCLNSTLSSNGSTQPGTLSKSVYLYVPSYTFNSPFEQAYLSQSVKTIKYTDVYQYQVLNVGPNQQFNSLITNGIANIKSVLVLPFYSSSGSAPSVVATYPGATVNLSTATGFLSGLPVWQSPFDPAGGGPTSPLCFLTNFNVQIAGQNAIYNTQRYAFEEYNNQLYGCNAVNGGLTDGLTSGLIGRQDFDMEYCYYYVNVERMLPVEETVPKSVNILGTNLSASPLDLIVWVEYGNEIKIDPLTGARV